MQHESLPGLTREMIPSVQPQQRAWLEIDRDAIRYNTAQLKGSLSPGCALMAVVKADGYGHGIAGHWGGGISYSMADLRAL